MTPHSHGENAPLARRRALIMLLRAATAPPQPRRPAARRPGRAAPKCTWRGAVAAGLYRGACIRDATQTLATTLTHDAHAVTQSPCASSCITNSPLLWRDDAARLLVALRMAEASAKATSTAPRRSRQARRCARHRVRSTCRCSSGGAARVSAPAQ